MICPQCRSADCLRSRRGGILDFFGTHAWRVAFAFAGYAHCWQCGNFDLERVSADRVPPGILSFVKRRLGFPAYRCDPCRVKFFSIRPHRRILPSIAPVVAPKAVNS